MRKVAENLLPPSFDGLVPSAQFFRKECSASVRLKIFRTSILLMFWESRYGGRMMGEFHYQVARYQHGWAYHLEKTYSSVFSTSWEAIAAAKTAAREMHEPGDTTTVRVQDRPLNWRTVLVIKRTLGPSALDVGLHSDVII